MFQSPDESLGFSASDKDVLRYCDVTHDMLPQPVVNLPSD